MTTNTTPGRVLAIVSGMAFSAGSLVILMGDVLTRPHLWEQYHVLTVLTVAGTIAAGHLMAKAQSAGSWLGALGFGLLFVSGTLLVVYNSVGRQAATSEQSVMSAEHRNRAIADKQAELDRARDRLSYAEKQADKEMTSERCGKRCRDWKQNAIDVNHTIRALEVDIASLGPKTPVAPKAAKMASIMALLGADEARAKAALMLLEPFLWTLFFEIGSIVSLGYAFRTVSGSSKPMSPDADDVLPDTTAIESDNDNVTDWAKAFKSKHGRLPTIPETKLAFPEISRSTGYRKVRAA